jgi:hypothetical protein
MFGFYVTLFFYFILFVMFGCYIKIKIEDWGRGVNCEEEMREKKMRWVRGDVCVWWGRRKKKGMGVHGWWGEKKKEIKKKKEMGSGEWGLRGKKWVVEKKEEKKLKGKQLNWFYLYVHFVWCKV